MAFLAYYVNLIQPQMPFTCKYGTIVVCFLKNPTKSELLVFKASSQVSTFGTKISHVEITWWFWFLIYFCLQL